MYWLDEDIQMLRDATTPCCPECNSMRCTYQMRSDFKYPFGVKHYWLYCIECAKFVAIANPNETVVSGDIKRGDYLRFYEIEGVKYPSVTSVLGLLPDALELVEWKKWTPGNELIMARRAVMGTMIHYRIGHWFATKQNLTVPELVVDDKVELRGSDLEAMKVIWSYFVDWVDDFNPTGLHQDKVVHSVEHGYAGSLDLICKIGTSIVLVDFKTGKGIYDKYAAQLTAYKRALLECSDIEVDEMAVARFNESGAEFMPVEDDWDLFERALGIYRKMYPKKVPGSGGTV